MAYQKAIDIFNNGDNYLIELNEIININNDEIKDVNSAPTIMILPSKKTYEDARDVDKILNWAIKN